MKKIFKWYINIPLGLRVLFSLLTGAVTGMILWFISDKSPQFNAAKIVSLISPFGNVFVYMLKMIVIPVIFFSLLAGAGSLSLKRFRTVGAKIITWYMLTSLFAAFIGVGMALLIKPGLATGLSNWNIMASEVSDVSRISGKSQFDGSFSSLLYSMFQNPFQSLAEGNFLAIIIFSILFGLALRVCIENSSDKEYVECLQFILRLAEGCSSVIFKTVDWVLEYSPVGIFALTIVNFTLYGPKLVSPYVSVTLGVVGGIIIMVFMIYPIIIWLATGQNPVVIYKRIQEAMIMALMTRSSAATLPVSMKIANQELKIYSELSSFSLPLGATIKMDGVCLHLPMFAILASNIFGIHITAFNFFLLVFMTFLASIGCAGLPGGSLMMLFIILKPLGLTDDQVSIIIALALGVNPILDMFETMANVSGDLICTYVVASQEKLIKDNCN